MDFHIVDDDECMCTFYALLSENLNFTAQTYLGSEEYLEFFNSDEYVPPKLAILTDVRMPYKSGYELMDIVREQYPGQRFVVLTGSPEVRAGNEVPCLYLVKPVSIVKLKKVFDAVSRCAEEGSNKNPIGCASIDDRCEFCHTSWHCPKETEFTC
ncbi:MAG: response regulator [bacterium]|nr:response regulator [Gammaproteobacteria bacterium]HIL97083.1 response regulator [Pseudomonadales bacterium]